MGNIQRHHPTLYTRDVSYLLDSSAHKVGGKKNADSWRLASSPDPSVESSRYSYAYSDTKIAVNYIKVTAENVFKNGITFHSKLTS